MKNVFPIWSLCFGLFICSTGSATGKEGGGGALLESAFRLRAISLIEQVARSPEANQLCSARVMQESLDSTQIRMVNQLVDPRNGTPIQDRNLDAFTVRGDMQLLESSWKQFLEGQEGKNGLSIEVLILHEVYRATGSECDDDNFRIATRIPKLLIRKGDFSKLFRIISSAPQGLDCTKIMTTEMQNMTCIDLDGMHNFLRITQGSYKLRKCKESSPTDPYECLDDNEERRLIFLTVSALQIQEMINLISFANISLPFYLYFDLKTAKLFYGFDLDDLREVIPQ